MINSPQANRSPFIRQRLARYAERARKPVPLVVEGKLTRIVGLTLEAVGCQAPIGSRCLIEAIDGSRVEAEVVGFSEGKLLLMAIGNIRGLVPNARVIPTHYQHRVPVGDALLGRVLDGAGNPLDDKGAIESSDYVTLDGREINPLQRSPVRQPLDVGVRSINSLLTIGRGQRMGLFAGSGVGKSVLMGMMTRYTAADITVVGLIGERGREVVEFVQNSLGAEGMARAVVVATPADNSPLMRMHGAMLATSIAEYFRDQGKQVLLLMDSLTRFAQAQREIALAIGEPPVTKGYPPSVFFRLPQLVERAGNAEAGGGSITALYTVLTEGDDHNDPIADAARAILDGHIVLSRELAESGLYPAINVEASISRTMTDVVDGNQLGLSRRFKQLYSTYQRNRDLISIGAYQSGSDPRVDEAIEYNPGLIDFLHQDMHQRVDMSEAVNTLDGLLAG